MTCSLTLCSLQAICIYNHRVPLVSYVASLTSKTLPTKFFPEENLSRELCAVSFFRFPHYAQSLWIVGTNSDYLSVSYFDTSILPYFSTNSDYLSVFCLDTCILSYFSCFVKHVIGNPSSSPCCTEGREFRELLKNLYSIQQSSC